MRNPLEGCLLQVKVLPKAKRNEIVGWEGEERKVRLAAVPERGAAKRRGCYLATRRWRGTIQRLDVPTCVGAGKSAPAPVAKRAETRFRHGELNRADGSNHQ